MIRAKDHGVLKVMPKIQISSRHLELDQYPTFDKLTSFNLNEIELGQECDPNLQFCDSVLNFESMLTSVSLPDLNHILEPTLILVPINLEHESPILESHITLLGNICEPLLFDLGPTLEPNSTLEPKFGLN